MKAVVVALCLFFSPAASFVSPALQRAARETAVKATAEEKAPGAAIAAAAVGAALIAAQPMAAGAITSEQRNQLSYEQVKGTGLANRCNDVVGTDSISIKAGGYQIVDFCLEPKTWQVEEEVVNKKGDIVKSFVNTKLMTRETYTLDGMSGPVSVADGKVLFKEEDGIDYAPTTIQLPGGERVPFLFTVKELEAKGSGPDFVPGMSMSGKFKVPSYRTGLFLDPKGRGMTTGYDMAQALAALQTGEEGDSELANENDKRFDVFKGNIEMEVAKVNAADGEIGGVFVSTQASDTDLGGKTPKKVLSKGIFFAKIEKI